MTSVLIIIPYRNRKTHMEVFLNKVYPLFVKHISQFKLLIIEQTDDKPFNRGKLLNVGIKENIDQFDIVITHDVDVLPTSVVIQHYYASNDILNIQGIYTPHH